MKIAEILEKATPRPWGLVPCSSGGILLHRHTTVNTTGQTHVQIVPAADAELIVEAVNAYEQNQQTIKTLREALELTQRTRIKSTREGSDIVFWKVILTESEREYIDGAIALANSQTVSNNGGRDDR